MGFLIRCKENMYAKGADECMLMHTYCYINSGIFFYTFDIKEKQTNLQKVNCQDFGIEQYGLSTVPVKSPPRDTEAGDYRLFTLLMLLSHIMPVEVYLLDIVL